MQEYTLIQEAVRSLSYADKVYLSLINFEEMTDDEIINTAITIYDHVKTMSSVISGGFKFSDAPTPNEHTQSLMIDDFNQKGMALVNFINKSDIVLNTFVKSYLLRESSSRESTAPRV